MTTDPLPTPLASTSWLAEHLDDPDLRILDATVVLTPPAGAGDEWSVASGQSLHDAAHVPGAHYANLIDDLSEPEGRFTRPSAERFTAAIERLGVGDGTRVVVYDRGGGVWAARLWWLLRSFGFDDAAVLDGGWALWEAEGRPVTASPTPVAGPASFTARERPSLFADRDDVLAVVNDGGACLVNALDREDFEATSTDRYPRPGRIPGSLSVPAGRLTDPATGRVLPVEELRAAFADVLARPGRKITYCGGGIAATADALALTLLGEEDVAVYDGSLAEWTADPALPLEVG